MSATLSPEDMDRLAPKRAGRKMDWYVHAFLFIAVSAFGWGLGLQKHQNKW